MSKMGYRPSLPFNVPMYLLEPTYTTVGGVRKKTYPQATHGTLFFGTFKTYGGTERISNDLFVVEDTATIETWFRLDIKSNCRIALAADPTAIYDVLGEPENIEMRNQYCVFKVQRVKGGA